MGVLVLVGLGVLTLTTPAPGQKTQPPDKEKLVKTEELIRTLYKKEFAKVKETPAAGKELAEELLKQARETKDDPVLRFVALSLARDLAATAGDHFLALAMVDELAQEFQIHVAAMKASVLAAAAKEVKDSEAGGVLLEAALDLVSEALAGDDFDTAEKLLGAARTAANHIKLLAAISRVEKITQEVRSTRKEFERIKPFVTQLAKQPDDSEANGEVGKYYCLYKGNWDKGLPLLVKGKDATLKDLAARDLAKPKASKKQVELGDAWWDLAEKEKAPAQYRLQERAAFWYELALPDLSGLARVRLEKRLEVVFSRGQSTAAITVPGPVGKVPVGEIRKFVGHTAQIKKVVFSPDGRRLFSGSRDGTLRLWEVETGKEIRKIQGPAKDSLRPIFLRDGKRGISGVAQTLQLWDLDKGTEIRHFDNVPGRIWGLALSPTGRQLATSHANNLILLWDLQTGKEVRRYNGHTSGVANVAISADGRHLLTAGHDNTARYWDVATGNEVRRFSSTASVIAVDLSRDGRWGVSAGWDNLVRLWDLKTGKEAKTFVGHTGPIYTVAFSPDGRRVLSAGQRGTVRLWDVATGKQIHAFLGHTSGVDSVSFAPHGRYAVSGGEDATIRLWGLPK
jgi:WD40 repeat protein